MLRFVVVRGVLGWGLCSGLAFALIQMYGGQGAEWPVFARNVALFMVGGIFWGATMWWTVERQKMKRQGR